MVIKAFAGIINQEPTLTTLTLGGFLLRFDAGLFGGYDLSKRIGLD